MTESRGEADQWRIALDRGDCREHRQTGHYWRRTIARRRRLLPDALHRQPTCDSSSCRATGACHARSCREAALAGWGAANA